ncbi:hypothetical protein TYRP_020207 [Tyrophagus putrescentiae]|nr:hypothetical protein TYRP_020207 [Tyrophagus putrescentiae]
MYNDHYHLGRLFLGLRSAAWSALHLDAQGSVDFYRERNRANQWRLAVASVSSGAKAQVMGDALGPLHLELGGKVGATSMSCSYFPDGQPVISSALRLTTSGDWYRLEGRYEGLNHWRRKKTSGSMVLAKRNLFQTGDRLLLGTSVEGFDEHHLFGRRATTSKYRWTAKWTSAASESVSFFNGGNNRTSVTTLIATLKDTSRISPPSPSNYCLSPGQHYYSPHLKRRTPATFSIFKYRRTVNRKWPWSDGVTKWTSLEKYKEVNSSGWEVKFGKGCWPIVSFGASHLTKERDEGRQLQQLKVKVNSRGELAATIVSYRTDLTSPPLLRRLFSPFPEWSMSGEDGRASALAWSLPNRTTSRTCLYAPNVALRSSQAVRSVNSRPDRSSITLGQKPTT